MTTARVRRAAPLPLRLGSGEAIDAQVYTFDGLDDGLEHLVVALGVRVLDHRPGPWSTPLVRLHSECLTGDVLGSLRCDCGPQLTESIARIHEVGGYLVYLRQEGRGIGLYNKIDAYALQDDGLDTFEANEALGFGVDERTYGVAAQMLLALGVERVELLTNNPEKADQLSIAGVHVERCLPTALHLTPANGRYLAAKACRGHLLPGLSAG